MLMGSDINPFDSQETKPYKNDPQIAAMTDLVDAYQRDDGTDDSTKGTYALEVYALEIQMYMNTRNNKRLKVLNSPTMW